VSPFLTWELDGSGQLHAPDALTLEKQPPVSALEALGGPQGRYERYGEESVDPAGNRTPASQPSIPYTSRHTD
jgi:hypothetical protein